MKEKQLEEKAADSEKFLGLSIAKELKWYFQYDLKYK